VDDNSASFLGDWYYACRQMAILPLWAVLVVISGFGVKSQFLCDENHHLWKQVTGALKDSKIPAYSFSV